MSLSAERKFQIITRNLQEVLGSDLLQKKLATDQPLSLYWGTAPTGKPHVAYFVPITKIADFLYAGCEVTILLADLHAYLDNLKAPWELLEYRSKYYEKLLKTMLEQINVPVEKLKFIRGTSYQLTQKYTLDTYRLFTMATDHDCKKAGAEVVKQVDSPYLSGLLYPGLQALDEEYLQVEAQFGGVDQRKIFTFAEKYLPKMGYKKRIHLMNPMVPGLTGDKMSSSDEDSKIDLLDDENSLKAKIKKSFCEEGNIESNGVLSFCKYVIFPIMEYHTTIKVFEIKRSVENGGDITIESYQSLEDMFAKKLLHPLDLKNATFHHINQIILPIREKFKNDPELSQLIKLAYPSSSAQSKKNGVSQNNPSIFVMKCGKITSIEKHPSIDDIIVAKLDLGDSQKVACIKTHGSDSLQNELIDQMVVVITNIKEYNFKGIKVDTQVLLSKKVDISTTNNGIINKVLPLNTPKNATLGESVYFEGFLPTTTNNNNGAESEIKILNLNKIKLDKFYDMIEVDDEGHTFFEGGQLVSQSGSIISLLKNAQIV